MTYNLVLSSARNDYLSTCSDLPALPLAPCSLADTSSLHKAFKRLPAQKTLC